jgi:hypothetical protein
MYYAGQILWCSVTYFKKIETVYRQTTSVVVEDIYEKSKRPTLGKRVDCFM